MIKEVPRRKSGATRQARYREKLARFGIKEVRGVRASLTERDLLNWLKVELGYSSLNELIMMEMVKVAAARGYALGQEQSGAPA